MALLVEDLDDQTKFRHILTISYQRSFIQFIFDYLMKKIWSDYFFLVSLYGFSWNCY